jgi:hypothetical protein
MTKDTLNTLIQLLKSMQWTHFNCSTDLNKARKFNSEEKRIADAAGVEMHNEWTDAMQIIMELMKEAE